MLPFRLAFSRQGIPETSFALLFWLNENVPCRLAFSRQGIPETSFALLFWLNENVLLFMVSLSIGYIVYVSCPSARYEFCAPAEGVSGGMMCKDTFFKLKNQSYKMKIFTFHFFIGR